MGKSGDGTRRLPPIIAWHGLDQSSQIRGHTWVKFVVGSLLFSGSPFFPFSSKANIPKFQFHRMQDLKTTFALVELPG